MLGDLTNCTTIKLKKKLLGYTNRSFFESLDTFRTTLKVKQFLL